MQPTDGAPRRVEAFEVIEVDAVGRPRLCRRHDLLTNERGLVEFREGYYAPGGAQHEYDPLAALGRKED
jgi:hypothetical protein